MIAPSLHPAPVRAAFEPRSRWAFGLTPRTVALLLVGFLGLIPGFWDARLAYSMLAWEFLVLLFAFLDGLRLPAPRQLTGSRTWSNAPALDSETEIELTIENHGSLIVECRLVDDLPPALVAHPATQRLTAFPRVPATCVTASSRGARRLGDRLALRALPLRPGPRRSLGPRAAHSNCPRLSRPAHRRGAANLSRTQPPDRPPTAPAQQRGLGRDFESLREYREGDDLRDLCWTATARHGRLITRQYQTERSQPVWIVLDCGRLMRARVALTNDAPKLRPCAKHQTRPCLHHRRRPRPARALLRRPRRPARLRPGDPAAASARTRRIPSAPDDRVPRPGPRRSR